MSEYVGGSGESFHCKENVRISGEEIKKIQSRATYVRLPLVLWDGIVKYIKAG